jgi:hypothetical protein
VSLEATDCVPPVLLTGEGDVGAVSELRLPVEPAAFWGTPMVAEPLLPPVVAEPSFEPQEPWPPPEK